MRIGRTLSQTTACAPNSPTCHLPAQSTEKRGQQFHDSAAEALTKTNVVKSSLSLETDRTCGARRKSTSLGGRFAREVEGHAQRARSRVLRELRARYFAGERERIVRLIARTRLGARARERARGRRFEHRPQPPRNVHVSCFVTTDEVVLQELLVLRPLLVFFRAAAK